MNRVSTTALAILLCIAPLTASPQATDSPYEKLKTYDFQNRTPADAISDLIKQANGDKPKLASIENNLDGVLDDPSATFAGKQEACRLISTIGTALSVPSLSRMLADEKTADIARYALERDSDPSAAKALRLALATTTGKTQIGVINSLGDRADPIAPGVLKKYIGSPDIQISDASITALGKIGNTNAINLLKTLPATNVVAGHALLRAAEQLAAAGSVPAALAIYEALATAARPAIVRAEAVRGLLVLNSPQAAKFALAALRSDDPYLQEVAARVIGTIGTISAVNPAMEIWPHLPPTTQIVLLTAFADRRDKSAIPIAFAALDSKDPALRAAGMRSAALMGGENVVARLVEILIHGDGADKGVARESLASMPGAEAERNIVLVAKTSNPETRASLMPVLAERPTPGAMAVLTEAASDSNKEVAVQALRALGRVGREQSFGDIVKVLANTTNDDVRDAAKDAAGAIAPKLADKGANSVYAVLNSASDAAKAALFPIVAEIGDERALKVLTTYATEPNSPLRQPAITALSDNSSDPKAMRTLLSIAQTDTDKSVKVQTLRGFLRILGQDERMDGDAKVAMVERALGAAVRPDEKRQALSVLRDCRVTAAMEACSGLLDDPDLFNDAASAVLYLAGKQRKNDRDQPAVTGPATNTALDRVIQLTKDEAQRAAAQKLRAP